MAVNKQKEQSQMPELMLVVLVGGSPQVVTETLYGLHKSGQPHPQHIRFITTTFGEQQIHDHELLGENGKINQFCRDYSLPSIPCSADDIHVITDNLGNKLADANNVQDHTDMADFIVGLVQTFSSESVRSVSREVDNVLGNLTRSELKKELMKQYVNIPGYRDIHIATRKGKFIFEVITDKYSLHASIAGGRKSMTFLLGYAMSLFGRTGDKVSHVLVDKKFESQRDFYYPGEITDSGPVYTDAQVSLAEVPVVFFNSHMPNMLLETARSYSETIDIFDAIQHAPQRLDMYCYIDANAPNSKTPYRVLCSGQEAWLSTEDFAFLWGWGRFGQEVLKDDSAELSMEIMNAYATLIEKLPTQFDDLENAAVYFADTTSRKELKTEFIFGKPETRRQLNNGIDPVGKKLQKGEFIQTGGIYGFIYDKYRNTLCTSLAKHVGKKLASMYTPQQTKRYVKSKSEDSGLYALPVDSANIFFYDSAGNVTQP